MGARKPPSLWYLNFTPPPLPLYYVVCMLLVCINVLLIINTMLIINVLLIDNANNNNKAALCKRLY